MPGPANIPLQNLLYMDGLDLFTNFGLFIEKGSANMLAYAAKKDGISHDWQDADGVEYDLSRIFLKDRTISLNMAMIGTSEADWMIQHDSFLALLRQPGLRRIEYTPHRNKQYFVFYKENTNYQAIAPLKGMDPNRFVGYKFILTLVEPNPGGTQGEVTFLYGEGQFIVT